MHIIGKQKYRERRSYTKKVIVWNKHIFIFLKLSALRPRVLRPKPSRPDNDISGPKQPTIGFEENNNKYTIFYL